MADAERHDGPASRSYASSRPGYPTEAVDLLLNRLAVPSAGAVVDRGADTGALPCTSNAEG